MIKIINKKFLIMLLISFIYAYLEGGNLPYSIFYGFLCTLIFSLVYLLATIRNVAVDIKFNRNIFTTFEDTEVITVVKNYGILPIPYIEINNKVFYELDKDYKGLVLSLGIDENRRLGVKVKFFTRGIYNFGEIKLQIRDIFSLFNFGKNIKKENIIKVYPKIYSLEKFNSYGEDVLNGMVNEKGNIKVLKKN